MLNSQCWKEEKSLYAPIHFQAYKRNLMNFFNHLLSILVAVTVSERLILDIDPLNSPACFY